MNSCAFCKRVQTFDRAYRDCSDEPFVIINMNVSSELSVPAVIYREHKSRVSRKVFILALTRLRDVATRVYGSGFYINTWNGSMRTHWFVTARPLSIRPEQPSFPMKIKGLTVSQ